MTRRFISAVGALLVLLACVAGSASAATTAGVGPDDETDAIGPPGGLPGPVPDFVTELLDTVMEFVGGVLDGTPAEGAKGPAVVGGDG